MRIEHVAMYPFNLDSISLISSSFPLPRNLSSSPASKPRRDRRRTDPVGRIIRQKAFPHPILHLTPTGYLRGYMLASGPRSGSPRRRKEWPRIL